MNIVILRTTLLLELKKAQLSSVQCYRSKSNRETELRIYPEGHNLDLEFCSAIYIVK